MILSVSLLILCAIAAIFLFRLISLKKIVSISELGRHKKELEAKYDNLLRQKWDAKSELAERKRELKTLINNQEGLQIRKVARTEISKEEEEQMISTFLLASGKITLEQDHKIRKEKHVLKMDYLTTSVALGYVDPQTANPLKRGNWWAKK